MMALNMFNGINEFIPDVFDRPSYHVENVVIRKRAVRKKKKSDWVWGDEQ